ncbi:carboxypeptidase B-like protein, partial [Dinothrombium tinctorium]
LALSSDRVRYDDFKVVIVSLKNKDEEKLFKQNFPESKGVNYFKEPSCKAPGTVLVSAAMLRRLNQSGLQFEVVNENFQWTLDEEHFDLKAKPYSLEPDIFNTFLRHDEMNRYLESLSKKYSSLASTEVIGYSNEGREMKIIIIGNGHRTKSKKIIWLDAGIHAREWAAPSAAIIISHKLLAGYGKDEKTTTIVDKYDFYILPCANPDGYEFTFEVNRLWRKTRRNCKTEDANECCGVDPNRNWGFHWNETGTSGDPCSDTYSGPFAFSENETRVMANYIYRIKNRLAAYHSYHAFSQLIMPPYGYTYQLPPNIFELMVKANKMANAIKYTSGNTFRTGPPPYVIYPAAGGSHDWVYGVCKVKYSYAYELRPQSGDARGFILPIDQIKYNGEEMWASFKTFCLII